MRLLICGATGVIGRYLVQMLAPHNEVTALVRSDRSAALAQSLGAKTIRGDILAAASLAAACEGQDAVINLATSLPRTFPGRPADFAMNDRIRREGTFNLLLGCEKAGTRHVVLESIIWVHGDQRGAQIAEDAPLHPSIVAQSAVEMEKQGRSFAERTGATVTILRCSGLYAAEAWHIREIVDRLRRRLVPIIGQGDNFQDFVHAYDAASAFALAATKSVNDTFFVTDDAPIRLGDYLRWLAKAVGAPEPMRIPQFVARMTLGSDMLEAYGASLRCLNGHIKERLGWAPRYPTIKEGYTEVLPRLGVTA